MISVSKQNEETGGLTDATLIGLVWHKVIPLSYTRATISYIMNSKSNLNMNTK